MSDNTERYNNVFKKTFEIDDDALNEKLTYQSIGTWDSVGHMTLIANLEDEFDIMMEMEDIVDFSSYLVGKELVKKYGVEL
jgi:acyl carrier protein